MGAKITTLLGITTVLISTHHRRHLLSRPSVRGVKGCSKGWKNVQDDPADPKSGNRLVILDEGKELASLPESARVFLEEKKFESVAHTLTLGYEHCSVEAVLKSVLPEGVDIPTSFETIGHIAHVNLRDEHKGYEQVIGQVLLDKNPKLQTVVNKTETLCHTVFRVFAMEVNLTLTLTLTLALTLSLILALTMWLCDGGDRWEG